MPSARLIVQSHLELPSWASLDMKKENLATFQMAGLNSLEQYLLAIFQGYLEHDQLGPERQRLASQTRNQAASALAGQWLAACELQAVQLH